MERDVYFFRTPERLELLMDPNSLENALRVVVSTNKEEVDSLEKLPFPLFQLDPDFSDIGLSFSYTYLKVEKNEIQAEKLLAWLLVLKEPVSYEDIADTSIEELEALCITYDTS